MLKRGAAKRLHVERLSGYAPGRGSARGCGICSSEVNSRMCAVLNYDNITTSSSSDSSLCLCFFLKFHEVPPDYDKQREFRKRKSKRLNHDMVSSLKVNERSASCVNPVPLIMPLACLLPRHETSV